jgi:hypothetical protein
MQKVLSQYTPDNIKEEVNVLWKSLENFKGLKIKIKKRK